MKPVLLVAYQYPPCGGSSGVLRALKFSKFLPEYGYAPHVLTLRESHYRVRDDTLLADIPPAVTVHRTFGLDSSRHLAIAGRHPAFLAVPDPFVSWLPFAVARGLRVIREHGIRAVYSTSPPPTTHLIAASLRRLARIPWIADFRDPWIEEGQYPRPGSLRARIELPLERWVMRTADRVVVTTPRLRAELLRRHPAVEPSRVVVVYNGYDEEDFAGAPEPGPNPHFEILHAGFVTPEFRDPFPLFRALRGLIDEGLLPREHARVTLLGGGPYLSSAGFRGELARLELGEVVNVADRVAHDEALALQSRAAVLLLLQASADTQALIPAKAFEYLRLGRPVLALTLEGDTADLLRGMEHCHVVNPGDERGLRRSLVELYGLWSDGSGGVRVRRPVERFERRRLTGQLAEVFDDLG